ncbi:sodium:solute symporter [Methanosarcina sp. 2.H.T.1A.6]|uniref:sodium:solute symporter family protein n=1 Tax=unclassified Methanosarcina TaxID=2644672 RepID=UPI000621D8FC|nr:MULTISPECIES: sodium:solute symporter family protein [unclassified Methanosarcina]KKG10624.1 sodium:solute symporter [Methanosarcina sp. 2.H.T.1A.15]KKG15088.1 sodium:solute symporter [Methanosarcina sp. 2.H.T.1A.3]KKG20787.1 sodium:solute symporter [Methanosarcina sp. 2.H.T.1A.8]KKG22104.1 sodium:solute symporter [Methanosarcina sp. 2.H.T.1A.6]
MAVNTSTLILFVLIYLACTFYVARLGYKKNSQTDGYMLAGRQVHPAIMALSYGAAFISTSAIIGFGGVAASLGMGLLWLVFMNIFFGIFIAFVVFGPRTRRMGLNLGSITYPEFIGKRFQSRFIQGFSGLLIAVFMPLYAASVLIGAGRFLETTLGINYNLALLIFTIIIASYVIKGGLLSVMYVDAMQGTLMLLGMAFLLVFTYSKLGGVVEAHQALTDMASLVPQALVDQGHRGWTAMPAFDSPIWWTMMSTITLGVGIGVLAQPQLAVRFMTVKDDRSLKRAVLVGGPFILMMAGVAYVVGALSNVYFYRTTGMISLQVAGGNTDIIMPEFLNQAMPETFVALFMLSLLAAAMSTAAAQFHTMGTSIGHDFYQQGLMNGKSTGTAVHATKLGIAFTILVSVALAYILPVSIIARATAMFMGLCTSAFLPLYMGALFWKRTTRAGATASLVVGSISSLFWLIFVHAKEAVPLKICLAIFGKETLLTGTWPLVDPILVATPLAFLTLIVVSLMTVPPSAEFLKKAYRLRFEDEEEEMSEPASHKATESTGV